MIMYLKPSYNPLRPNFLVETTFPPSPLRSPPSPASIPPSPASPCPHQVLTFVQAAQSCWLFLPSTVLCPCQLDNFNVSFLSSCVNGMSSCLTSRLNRVQKNKQNCNDTGEHAAAKKKTKTSTHFDSSNLHVYINVYSTYTQPTTIVFNLRLYNLRHVRHWLLHVTTLCQTTDDVMIWPRCRHRS